MAFLIDFVFNGQALFDMEHNFIHIDESGMSRKKVLDLFLVRICEDLKENLETGSSKHDDNQTGISEAQLIQYSIMDAKIHYFTNTCK